MVQYKLYYFRFRGSAEPIRLLFNYKGIPFEDIRIKGEEWSLKKSAFPFGLPVLEEDEKKISHAWAILHYLAKKFELDGKDECEVVRLDQIVELGREMGEKLCGYIYVAAGVAEGNKNYLRKNKALPALEHFGPYFEYFLKESDSGFYGKNGVSYVDFYMAEATFTLYQYEKELMKSKYPFFIEHMEKVHALPELKHYLSTRSTTAL